MEPQLQALFLELSPQGRAAILTRLAHEVTIIARGDGYAEDGTADGVVLRGYNELVHKLVGHAARILESGTGDADDASFIAMLAELPQLMPRLSRLLRQGFRQ
ncbi:hypothetical protein [Ferrovibrio terrae]|uniref:hypothetical protein n=1 Tax=Ferrovibrio terrae TaxID=2594003 RepID=UPI0031379D78